ncbi:hypothetical protein KY290_021586 [Solanum tuberosum]|uniref:Uncharacterized protein n=1 Tax=Solanum tuberosum TaxID=4113 RepID=A0ABQ7V421_SOLTU|nr:hypothetical protein KY289_020746 [Solanum tuberosum]KAH0758093.1 hypothetical protein KY290_021586 [Solanum tuberosum]
MFRLLLVVPLSELLGMPPLLFQLPLIKLLLGMPPLITYLPCDTAFRTPLLVMQLHICTTLNGLIPIAYPARGSISKSESSGREISRVRE